MNDLPPEWRRLRKNKRRIIEFVLRDPVHLWSYPYFKEGLCGKEGMSERRLRSNLKSLVNNGILGSVEVENGGVFYGPPHVANDPVLRGLASSVTSARGEICVTLKTAALTLAPEEMIEWLKKAREKPIIRPTGRSRKVKKAQFRNYILGINWQIDQLKQVIAKTEMEKRRQEIADKYSMTPREMKSSRP